MKHIFVVNPMAGSKNSYNELKTMLQPFMKDYDIELYQTAAPKDATRFVKEYCEKNPQPVRFYACGGDGTLNEVVNGAVGFENAYVGCVPCGSGDDFIKYYGGKKYFSNIADILEAKPEKIDLMKVENDYALNVVNFGFDTAVLKTMLKVKRLPLLGGKRAYYLGVVTALFSAMKNKCEVYADDVKLNDKTLLLATVANGNYVGSSFKCAPNSYNNDGLLEVCLFRPVSVLKFISLVSFYTEGSHLTNDRCRKIMKYQRAKKIRVVSPNKKFYYSLDGEMIDKNDFSVEVVPNALNFLVPQACFEYRRSEQKRIEQTEKTIKKLEALH